MLSILFQFDINARLRRGLADAWSQLLAIRLLLVPIGVGVGIGIGIDSDCVASLPEFRSRVQIPSFVPRFRFRYRPRPRPRLCFANKLLYEKTGYTTRRKSMKKAMARCAPLLRASDVKMVRLRAGPVAPLQVMGSAINTWITICLKFRIKLSI